MSGHGRWFDTMVRNEAQDAEYREEVKAEREELAAELRYHDCGDDGEPEYDAQGIYLCRTCRVCRKAKLAGFRPEILTGYDQSDVDEPIEEDL